MGLMENALVYGEKCAASFASYDRESSSWKTSQLCFTWDLAEYSENWPRAGMTRNGIAFPLSPLVPLIDGTEFSFVPTPQALEIENPNREYRSLTNAYRGEKKVQPMLSDVVKLLPPRGMWPTPTVCGNYNRKGASPTSGDGLATAVGGKLNPTWVEWLMGYPLEWTDLKDSATPLSRKSRSGSRTESKP
jgi:hypothetical protein